MSERERTVAVDAARTPEALAAAFAARASVEVTPRARVALAGCLHLLDQGSVLYIAHPPRSALAEVVDMACWLAGEGYVAVPHLVARNFRSGVEFERALEHLKVSGVERALVVAGDRRQPEGPFASSLDLLETGLFEGVGLRAVGVAGHPQGNRAVGPQVLRAALSSKIAWAARSGMDLYVVTQFGFDAQALIDWETGLRRDGLPVSVHVGLAGPTPLPRLIRYAMQCGIGASLRTIANRTSAMAHLATVPDPEDMVAALAHYCAENPDTCIVQPHLFSFGGTEATVRWLAEKRWADGADSSADKLDS